MKYIKIYEKFAVHHDYVAIDPNGIRSEPDEYDSRHKKIFHEFVNSNVGSVISFYTDNQSGKIYRIGYRNEPPREIFRYFLYDHGTKMRALSIRGNKILYYSKNKEDVETFLSANKYNL